MNYGNFNIIKEIKFKDVIFGDNDNQVAVDVNGKVWTWGSSYLGTTETYSRRTPMCISDIEGHPFNNVRIKKISGNYYSSCIYALDEEGKIWLWGIPYTYHTYDDGKPWQERTNIPICLSDRGEYLKDVVITDVFVGNNKTIAIDNKGKVWLWGYNNRGEGCSPNEGLVNPTCISDLEGINIQNIKMKKVAILDYVTLFLDVDNKLWACGDSNSSVFKKGIQTESESSSDEFYWNPICLNYNNETNPLNGIEIIDISYDGNDIIDVNGKLWTGVTNSSDESPICISNLEDNKLDTVKLVSTCGTRNSMGAAIDSDGNIWMWGSNGTYLPLGSEYYGTAVPTRITISNNAHFEIPKFKKISAGPHISAGIDENGKVWTWGYESYKGELGAGYAGYNYTETSPIMVGGYNNQISREKIRDVSVGYNNTLAIDDKGKLWYWGNNNYRAGLGNKESYFSDITDPICITNNNVNGNILYRKEIVKIATAGEMYAVIDSEGKLYTCGNNRSGNLGNGTLDNSYASNSSYKCINYLYDELRDKKIIDISISNATFAGTLLVLDEDGKVWTCGYNSEGQLGYNAEANSKKPSLVCISDNTDNLLYGKKITNISAGAYHSVALDEEGKVYLWGKNENGELGDGTGVSTYNPICLTDNEESKLYGKIIKKISAGENMTLVVDSEGKAYTCGLNINHQLGQGVADTSYKSLEMECINKNTDFIPQDISISADYSVIAIDTKGDAWAWGKNEYSINGLNSEYSIPTRWIGESYKYDPKVESFKETEKYNVQDILTKDDSINGFCAENIKDERHIGVTNNESIIALDNDGKLWTWGVNNTNGILGDGTTSRRDEPKCINNSLDGADVEEILYADTYMVFVKDVQGKIWSWGNNNYGKLGVEYIADSRIYLEPQCISNKTSLKGQNIVKIYTFFNMVAAIDEKGKVYTWGQNSGSIIGTEAASNSYNIPACISDNSDMYDAKIESMVQISGSMFAIAENGQMYTWGSNNNYACATNDTQVVKKPIKFCKGTDLENLLVKEIKYIDYSFYIITKDGELYSWGRNSKGLCGTGTTSAVMTPVCISSKFNFKVLSMEYEHSWSSYDSSITIIDTNGDIWTWGNKNNYGQLGTGTTDAVLTPTNISKNKFKVKEVLLKGNTNVILDTNGDFWTWGLNSYGQCLNGTKDNVLEPTHIELDKKIEKVLAKTASTGIILKDTEGKAWILLGSTYRYASEQIMIDTVYAYDTVDKCWIVTDTEGKVWSFNLYRYYSRRKMLK